MRPGYKERIDSFEGGMKTTTIRVPRILMDELNVYAAHEKDRESDLLREGVLRVIEDRRADKEYMAAVSAHALSPLKLAAQARIERLTMEVNQAQAQLDTLGGITEQPGE